MNEVRKLARSVVLLSLVACGGPGGAPTTPPASARGLHDEAVAAVARATTRVKAALHRRRESEAAARAGGACAPLLSELEALELAWAALKTRWVGLAEAAAPWSARVAGARAAAERVERQRLLDLRDARAWRAHCSSRAQVQALPKPAPVEPEPLCDGLTRHGEVLHLAREVDWARPHATLEVVRALSDWLADEWDLLFIVAPGLEAAQAHGAALLMNRGHGGRYAAAHLPRWRRLHGALVFGRSLTEAPSLHAVARPFGNDLRAPGCSPQLGLRGHWGYAEPGGQLGGGFLEPAGEGTWRLRGGLIGNCGNHCPYSGVELWLMGLAPPDEAWVRFLESPEPQPDGRVRAAGTCAFSGAALPQRFGERPRREVLKVGLVVVAPTLDPLTLEGHRRALASFTRVGADEDPDRLDFWEATGGRGRLEVLVPAPRRACRVGP